MMPRIIWIFYGDKERANKRLNTLLLLYFLRIIKLSMVLLPFMA